MLQIINCPDNKAWREERAKSVGASAIGTILGLNRCQGPIALCEKMRAELRGEFDYNQTLAQLRGHAYEGGVATLFAHYSSTEIIASSAREYIVRRSEIPHLHVSPDRMFWIDPNGPKHGKISESNKGMLECKTTQSQVNRENFPVAWYLQLQAQMGVTGYHKGAVAWDVLNKKDGFDYHFFRYNEEVYQAIVEVTRDFWQAVVSGEYPKPVGKLYKEYPILYRKVSLADPNNPEHIKPIKAKEKPFTGLDEVEDLDEEREEKSLGWLQKLFRR